ncbi:MAG TPA: rRNA maturation RNase YbeY [Steroidobacteraceae bacterium]|nr:rRNA maturation RNase YbeY [Steroidobacteraceae bacterium]
MTQSRRVPARSPLRVDVQTGVRTWAPRARDIATWAGTAIGRRASGGELGVRVVGSAESRRLNARYRGKDKPTNVLSFAPYAQGASGARAPRSRKPGRVGRPVSRSPDGVVRPASRSLEGEGIPLGDLVICAPVVRSEAREQGKLLEAHWAHLVVHGALHLIGYDHEREAEAKRMERREIAVLRRLGFANPYRI